MTLEEKCQELEEILMKESNFSKRKKLLEELQALYMLLGKPEKKWMTKVE